MARSRTSPRARRYVAWIDRHAFAIVVGHVLALAASIALIAYHLPLRADFAYLLPQDAPAVRDMRKLEGRLRTNDTVLVVVQAPTAAACAAATRELIAGARALPRGLVARVDGDDAEARAYLDAHRFLLIPLDELDRAAAALRRRIERAKLEANPLYVDLDDDAAVAAERDANQHQLDDLRARWRDAEARLHRPSNVSADGKTALIQVKTAVAATEVGRGQDLLEALTRLRAAAVAAHPGVEIGFAGDLVTALSEHRAIVHGTLISCVVTTLLVGLLLALYFRSAVLLGLLITTLAIGTTASFGAAALTIGHLNAATAFLGAIIAGNGVNYGILLIARYLEERRHAPVDDAVAAAVTGTLNPTLVASLGASIAYGSLAATSFKGFADFAVIGAIGMALCWIASFLLLPALILRFGRRARSGRSAPVVGCALARVLGFRRSRLVVAVAGVMVVAALGVVIHYVAADPFEYDLRELGSDGADARLERHWMKVSDHTFGRGHAGRTFIAADRPDQVPRIVAALRAEDAGKPPAARTIGSIESILDVVPADQPARLARLAELRSMLDDDALDDLDDHERAQLDELRPPAGLAPVTVASLPPTIREKLTEQDGRVGYVVSVRPADRLDELDGHDVIRFAAAVSKVDLGDGETVTTSGPSVIFASILEVVGHDGPIVTIIAAAGLVVLVLLLVGGNRRAAAVLIATGAGSLFMVATCALLALKVNFLDFVALPITLGLGVDYAINIAYRHDHGDGDDPACALRTSGSAVLLCSLTTVIGYGSLLVSDNLAIRGFGTASLIGELTSVLTALVLVPALLTVSRREPVPASATAPHRRIRVGA